MSDRARRAFAQAAWRLIVLALLTLAPGWDAVGLLVGGDRAYRSPSYDVLRSLTPWGMRVYGPVLLALVIVTVYAYGRYSSGSGVRGYALLRLCLSALAGWYALWAAGIGLSWWVNREQLDWGGVGKLAFVAAVCVILARTTPTDGVRAAAADRVEG